MADIRQITRLLLFLLLSLSYCAASSKEDLDGAEANGKLEIIKQIKKVNDDGSYTIGYEADDGSFKIESRDVLGNIKGTYGYIDERGDIKRVSYSANNGSESSPKTEQSPSPSVVQRIPKVSNKSSPGTTKRPGIVYQSAATTQTPSVINSSSGTINIQAIPKRRTTTTTTALPPTTSAEHLLHGPRILLQQRASALQKSEGQIIRPDVIAAVHPTELPVPIYKRKSESGENTGDDGKGNLLRRQLIPEKAGYDPKQHAFNLQQSHGDDVVDVYSSSMTTGTPRPLFTTLRPKFVASTVPPNIPGQAIRVYSQYPKPPRNGIDYASESSTESIRATTPIPVAQIPANREPLIAIQHPVHGRTVLVPLSQLQDNPATDNNNRYTVEYPYHQPQQQQQPIPPVFLPQPNRQPQRLRAIPVRIDQNGFVREMPPAYHNLAVPYSTQSPDYFNGEDEIDLIKPPVSTRDFQKLLEQLILRQSRLEQISQLTSRYQHSYGQRNRPIYRPNLLLYQRKEEPNIRYTQRPQHALDLDQQNMYNYQTFAPTAESYVPTRRVARLLTAQHQQQKVDEEEEESEEDDDYLPPDVREMLLLRMLQLAINPSLPLNIPDNFEENGVTLAPLRHQRKMGGARNVQILGEEEEAQKIARNKR